MDNNRTLTFDLSALSDVASLTVGPSFTSKGTKYLHLFNISLCNHEVREHVPRLRRCRNHSDQQIASLLCHRGGEPLSAPTTSPTSPAKTTRAMPLSTSTQSTASSVNQPSSRQMGGASRRRFPPSPSASLTLSSVCERLACSELLSDHPPTFTRSLFFFPQEQQSTPSSTA